MYTEASSPNYPSKSFYLTSPEFMGAQEGACRFAYHMYGSAMGTLEVQVSDDGSSWTTIWSESGNQGNVWGTASTSWDSAASYVRFYGLTGSSFTSDMAVDDVELAVTTPLPSPVPTGETFTVLNCSFEDSGLCGFTTASLAWTWQSGGTSSSNTGPSAAYDGSYYMYTEASSPNYPSKSFYLTSPEFMGAQEGACRFAYHMYGSAMGTLEVQVSDDGSSWTTIWSKSANQGNVWGTASTSWTHSAASYVQFYG